MTLRGSTRHWIGALLVAALVLVPSKTLAEGELSAKLPMRQATLAWNDSVLRATMTFRDAVPPPLVAKLGSGITTIIAVRAYVMPADESSPVALAARTCRVVYDLWDEVYRVRVTGPGGDRDLAVLSPEGVLRQCAETRDLAIVERAHLKAGRDYYLGVIVDVNPVSPQMLEQMRRWISRPTGATRIGPSDALFGSFVGLFVRQIGASDSTLRFRTQTFRG